MSRLLIKILYGALILLVLLACMLAFLVSTTPGLYAVIKLSQLYFPGTIKVHQFQGSLLDNFTVDKFEYQNKQNKISINQLNVHWHLNTLLHRHVLLAQWHDLQWEMAQNNILNSPQGTITASGTLPDLNLHLSSEISQSPIGHWHMNATINGTLPWQWTINAKLNQSHTTQAKHPGLYSNLSLQGHLKDKNHGTMILTSSPGHYQLPDNNAIHDLQFTGGSLNIVLSPQQLKGKGLLVLDQNKQLNLEFQLPKFALDKGLTNNQSLNSELSLQLNSLDFLKNISPELNNIKGQFIASVKTSGTLGTPQLENKLILNKASLFIPKLGLHLDAIDCTVLGKENHWEATGSITSANHNLLLTGGGILNSGFTGSFSLQGDDFPIIKTHEYQINVSPRLNLNMTPSTRQISGSILVPYAQIKPQRFNNSLSLPDDVVYKNTNETPSIAWNTGMDIRVEMGKEVELIIKGLKAHLNGTVNVKQLPQGSINAYGELSVRDGTYKAYGQDLTIDQGQLIYTGGQLNNPGINLRASKTINNTPETFSGSTQLFDFNNNNLQSVNLGSTMTLGVEVTGRLIEPKIQLFSNPAVLSQADILSMLVLGRPASQANKAGGQLLLAAISSMNLGGGTNGTQLLEQLKQISGLDFNVQTNTNYNQLTNTVSDSTAVVVGKSLSKHLYLSYNIGLSQTDTNMLTVKYLLNKFFSIQISNSDTSSGIDILYTSNKKVRKPKVRSQKK